MRFLFILLFVLSSFHFTNTYADSGIDTKTVNQKLCSKLFYFGKFLMAKGPLKFNRNKAIEASLAKLNVKFIRQKNICEDNGGAMISCKPTTRTGKGGRWRMTSVIRYQCLHTND